MSTTQQTDRSTHDDPTGAGGAVRGRPVTRACRGPGPSSPGARSRASWSTAPSCSARCSPCCLIAGAGAGPRPCSRGALPDDYHLAATPGRAASMAQEVADRATGLDRKVHVRVVPVADDGGPGRVDRQGGRRVVRRGADGWVLVGRDEVPSNLEDVTTTVVRDTTLTENAEAAGATVGRDERGSELTTDVLEGDADQRDFAKGMAFALAFLFYVSSIAFGYDPRGQRRRGEAVAHRRDHRDQDPGAAAARRQGARQHRAGRGADGAVRRDRPGRAQLHLVRRPAADGHRGARAGSSSSSCSGSCCSPACGPSPGRSPAAPRTSSPPPPRSRCCCSAIFFGSAFLQRHPADRALVRAPASAVLMPQRILEGKRPVVGAGRRPRHPARDVRRGGARRRAALPPLAAADPGPDLVAPGVVRAGVAAAARRRREASPRLQVGGGASSMTTWNFSAIASRPMP